MAQGERLWSFGALHRDFVSDEVRTSHKYLIRSMHNVIRPSRRCMQGSSTQPSPPRTQQMSAKRGRREAAQPQRELTALEKLTVSQPYAHLHPEGNIPWHKESIFCSIFDLDLR